MARVNTYDALPQTDRMFDPADEFGDEEMREMGGAMGRRGGDDPLYDTFVIDNARSNRGGYKAAAIRLLVGLCFLVLGVMFFFFAGFDLLNTRLDYNTDFSDRNCRIDSGDTCQERDLRRVRGVDINWFIAAAYTAIGICYFWVTSLLWGMHLGGTHDDASEDPTEWTHGLKARFNRVFNLNARRSSEVMQYMGWWQSFNAAVGFVEDERMNGFTINHNVLHIIYDTIVYPILLASLGVRDFWKLMIFGALVACAQTFLWYAQIRNRTPWKWGKKNALNIKTSNTSVSGTVNWLGLLVYSFMNGFIFSMFMVYAWKFPHKSRTWYMIVNMIIVLIYIPLHTLYQLGYYGAADLRVAARNSNPFSVLARLVMIPFTAFPGGWMIIALPIALMLVVPFTVMAAFYLIVRFASACYMFIDSMFEDRERYPGISGRAVCDIFFTLWDLVMAFVPIMLLLGLDGHANIARIVFPVTQTYVY